MDWFERLTGFKETSPETVRRMLAVDGERLVRRADGASWAIGRFELTTLEDLRARPIAGLPTATRFSLMRGDVGAMHADPANAGALFQVASQFNALEMIDPDVTPEDGVTIYEDDPTQGPVCAMSAGAATIFRNFFIPLEGGVGQTRTRQIDAIAPMRGRLAAVFDVAPPALWEMRNGYLLVTNDALKRIGDHIRGMPEAERDALRASLAIALQHDVEVTREGAGRGQRVSQAFCSALPIAYNGADVPVEAWEPFARLVLEAAYQATLRAASHRPDKRVFLTLLGGGAFGNPPAWILDAVGRALDLYANAGLDVRLVSYHTPDPTLVAFAQRRACRI